MSPTDSKTVDKALRADFWPALAGIGFNRRTGRTAWRDRRHCVQTVNIQSFNRYLCGPAPMHAVFLLREPRCVLPGRGGSRALGTVGEGPIATCRALAKGIPQPDPEPERPPIPPPDPRLEPRGWSDRPDVWYVRTDGANLDEVVEDARNIVLAVGVPWLERLADVADARQHFAEAPSTNHARGIVAEGYEGALGSPARERAVDALDELIARLRA